MAKKTLGELVSLCRFWLSELYKDEHTGYYADLRFGVNGLEMRLTSSTLWKGGVHLWQGQWFDVHNTSAKAFWECFLDQLVECHRSISSYKLLGETDEAKDLAAGTECQEDDIPF